MKKTILAIIVSACALAGTAQATDNNYQAQIDSLRDGLHDVHMNTLQKYSESWGLEDRANIADMKANKLDKSVYETGLAHQATTDSEQDGFTQYLSDTKVDKTTQADRDAGQDTHINAVQDAAQIANEKGDANAVRSDRIEQQAGVLDGRVGNTEVRLDTVEGGVRETNASVSYTNSRIDAANQNIEMNRQASIATNKRVAQNSADIANNEQRITSLEQETRSNYSNLKSQVDDNRKRASAAISGVAAMANIPQVTEYQSFSVGAGVGTADSESALAVGMSARLSQNWVMKASLSNDTQQNFVFGAGAAYGW